MIKKAVVLFSGLVIAVCLSANVVLAVDYAHELKDKDMSVAWSVDGDKLAVKMSAKTEGWVGVGFNPSKQMKDANFVLGYVKKGEAKIIDEFGTSNSKHSSDEKLGGTVDAVLVGGTEEKGITTIEFTIPLTATDKNDTTIDATGDTILLLAHGAGRDSFKSKHNYRATFKVNLSTGAAEEMK